MNATALPSAAPSPVSTARQRAIEIIRAWTAWRASRAKLDSAVDGAMLGCLIVTWVIGYALVCPVEPVRHLPNQHIAVTQR